MPDISLKLFSDFSLCYRFLAESTLSATPSTFIPFSSSLGGMCFKPQAPSCYFLRAVASSITHDSYVPRSLSFFRCQSKCQVLEDFSLNQSALKISFLHDLSQVCSVTLFYRFPLQNTWNMVILFCVFTHSLTPIGCKRQAERLPAHPNTLFQVPSTQYYYNE